MTTYVPGAQAQGAPLFILNGAGVLTPVSATDPVPTSGGAATAANILTGTFNVLATTAATTVITVPAGRTWVGTVAISCACATAAAGTTAGQARAVVTTAGTGVTPAGTVVACDARNGANAATGTVGSQAANSLSVPLTVIAPAGNSVTVQAASTIAGSAASVDVACVGALV